MATLLVNLRHVPEDEAEGIRRLLERSGIPYYETPPNHWGISMGAIWARDDADVPRAIRLLADFQQERATAARATYHTERLHGLDETLWTRMRRKPLAVMLRLALATLILYLTVGPFLGLL